MTSTSVKVIFDTNVWISFLIGKRLSKIKKHISEGSITRAALAPENKVAFTNPKALLVDY